MKKILLILLLVLAFCSCGVSEETVPEEPQSEPEISGSSASEPAEKAEKSKSALSIWKQRNLKPTESLPLGEGGICEANDG